MEIIALLSCLQQTMSKKTLRQLGVIVTAVLGMSGRVTQLGIARWAEKGGSYRTVQRFFHTPILWLEVNWALVSKQLLREGETLLLAGDETVTSKAGKKTYGRDRFFSSIQKQMIPSVAFFAISLISVNQHRSSVLHVEQLTKEQTTQHPPSATAKSKKKKSPKGKQGEGKPSQGGAKAGAGRPKGRQTQKREDVELPVHLLHIQRRLEAVLQVIRTRIAPTYMLLDGAFGNNHGVQMVRRCGLHLISRLHHNAALYFPYTGQQKKYGTRRKYGDKFDPKQIPECYLKQHFVEGNRHIDTYQMPMWHKTFPDLLNIVVLVCTDFARGHQAHIILFSSDLCLPADELTRYYRLRFQIEFNFRDAKQFWGLDDFMAIRQLSVTNAANFAFFMVNVSHALIAQISEQMSEQMSEQISTLSDFSVTDLKAHYRGRRYLQETLKLLPPDLAQILSDQLFARFSSLGAIHHRT